MQINFDDYRRRNILLLGRRSEYANVGEDRIESRSCNGNVLSVLFGEHQSTQTFILRYFSILSKELIIYKELKRREKNGIEGQYKASNVICYEDSVKNFVIKAESNGELIVLPDNRANFENLFLPRKLKSGVLVVDLPLQVLFCNPKAHVDSGSLGEPILSGKGQ